MLAQLFHQNQSWDTGVTVPQAVGSIKKTRAPVKVLIENSPTLGAPADDQSKIHAATEPAPLQNGVKQSPDTERSAKLHR